MSKRHPRTRQTDAHGNMLASGSPIFGVSPLAWTKPMRYIIVVQSSYATSSRGKKSTNQRKSIRMRAHRRRIRASGDRTACCMSGFRGRRFPYSPDRYWVGSANSVRGGWSYLDRTVWGTRKIGLEELPWARAHFNRFLTNKSLTKHEAPKLNPDAFIPKTQVSDESLIIDSYPDFMIDRQIRLSEKQAIDLRTQGWLPEDGDNGYLTCDTGLDECRFPLHPYNISPQSTVDICGLSRDQTMNVDNLDEILAADGTQYEKYVIELEKYSPSPDFYRDVDWALPGMQSAGNSVQ